MQLLHYTIKQFEANKEVFRHLLENTPPEQVKWKQAEDKWSLLEIIGHLADEEKEDFRTRLKSVLEDPEKPFPAIDPLGWVVERKYIEQDFATQITKFVEERNQSIQWLKSLEHANWENTYQHPSIGAMSGSFILANWLAHDYLHFRQITRLKYDFLKASSQQNLGYAGNW